MEARLQIVCLVIIMYISVIYIKETSGKMKVSCNCLFDAILAIAPWAVVFDGFSAITVNHRDAINANINLFAHGMFFLCMNLVIIVSFFYMLDITIGRPKCLKTILYLMPGIISIVLMLLYLPKLEFIKGSFTDYSMGTSVYISFLSFTFYYGAMLAIMFIHRKTVESKKWYSMLFIIVIAFLTLIVQCILPEILLTSIMPTILLLGLYINMEDPFIRRFREYNENMVSDFATLVENRDNNTGGHIKRTKEYVRIILKEIRNHPDYKNYISRDYIRNVENAAPMHDIGKISTPDHILQKPGKLTDEEYEIMKQHASKGGEIIEKTFSDLSNPEFEKIAFEVARFHHEKWNGRGYPDGLKGEEIPLHARIMAIADVFDAVSAKRVYRDALPIDTCFKIIEDGIGNDFDPELAKLFLKNKEEVLKVYKGCQEDK